MEMWLAGGPGSSRQTMGAHPLVAMVGERMSRFQKPKFDDRSLEVIVSSHGVSIYGTKQGIKKLAELCDTLARNLPEGSSIHLHIEDYELLTPTSLPLVVACFDHPMKQSVEHPG
jgi:hypothetical protein